MTHFQFVYDELTHGIVGYITRAGVFFFDPEEV